MPSVAGMLVVSTPPPAARGDDLANAFAALRLRSALLERLDARVAAREEAVSERATMTRL